MWLYYDYYKPWSLLLASGNILGVLSSGTEDNRVSLCESACVSWSVAVRVHAHNDMKKRFLKCTANYGFDSAKLVSFGANVNCKGQMHSRIFFQYLFQLMGLSHFFVCVALVNNRNMGLLCCPFLKQACPVLLSEAMH